MQEPFRSDDLREANEHLERASPVEILRWARDCFGNRLAATSSFQTQSVPLLHMIATVCPELPVYFLDTGFHFPETLAFRDQLAERLGLNIVDLHCAGGHSGFLLNYGKLYSADPDLCCYVNKVEPLQRALLNHSAWVTGIRRDQTTNRSATPIVALGDDERFKIAPLANWTSADIAAYLIAHGLPGHPLTAGGFGSIGCQPCTRALQPGEGERAGRWAGSVKTECGLHTDYFVNGPVGMPRKESSEL